MPRLSLRSLIPLAFVLAMLAGSPLAQDANQRENSPDDSAREASMSESEREDVLLRKAILLGFPAAAVGGLIIALIVTRKKRPGRRDDTE
jgi:hypothetical protein